MEDTTGTGGYVSLTYKYSLELSPTSNEPHSTSPTTATFSVFIKLFRAERLHDAMAVYGGGDFDEGKQREVVQKLTGFHNRECVFYSQFGGGKVDGFPLAEVYYMRELDPTGATPPIVIMENLSGSAYMAPLEEGFNRRKVESVVRHLAALHAHILCRGDREECLRPFRGCLVDAWYSLESRRNMVQKAVEIAPEIEPVMRRMRRSYLSQEFWDYAFSGVGEKYGVPALLVHGDLWTNNLLWRRTASGEESDEVAVLIDWQCAYAGCFLYDFTMLVVMCCDAGVRRELETDILELYHAELGARMAAEGGRKEPPFTVERLRPVYEMMTVLQAEMLVGCMPLFMEVWVV